MSLITSIIFSR